jgi:hypothetical protein
VHLKIDILETSTTTVAPTTNHIPIPIVSPPRLPDGKLYHRWGIEEESKLQQMKTVLAIDLANVPEYMDVVGDRRLLRFLRGHNLDINKACFMYRKFLKFRQEHKVDQIRDRICK